VRKLHAESKALVGMMSLLPAEVNIEEHIKVIVLGFSKDRAGGRSCAGACASKVCASTDTLTTPP
jgi:hypothetical protein